MVPGTGRLEMAKLIPLLWGISRVEHFPTLFLMLAQYIQFSGWRIRHLALKLRQIPKVGSCYGFINAVTGYFGNC